MSFDLKVSGDVVSLSLSGHINEDFDFSKIQIGNPKILQIDLDQVKSINSCGIREWIKWFSQMNNVTVELYKCPKIIVDQINMVQGFLPSFAKVKSFYVPFYNEDSGTTKNLLFEYGKDFTDGDVKVPENVVDEQGNPMEIDVIESKYFKFILKK